MRKINPMVQARIFQARQKKATHLRLTANVCFIKGVKAGAEAARHLIKEGYGESGNFAELVLAHIKKPKNTNEQPTRID